MHAGVLLSSMPALPVSLQLWSVRDAVRHDFAGTVQQLAAFGYDGVELAGYGNLDAAGAAQAIASAGLRCTGMHVGFAALRDDPEKVILEAQLLGSPHVICPYFPREIFKSAAVAIALALELDRIGAYLRACNLTFSYHNHEFELARFAGRLGLDLIFDHCAPANVACEADVYWLHQGGKNPAAFIREQGRRVRLLHLKDETELGSGPVDFASILAAAESIGAVETHVIEIERYNHEPMESARRSLATYRSWRRG